MSQTVNATNGKNGFLRVLNTAFVICTPLVLLAYLTRVLTPQGVGQYSYASSVIAYFTVFAALGFGHYARRELVKERDNAYNRSCLFWDIFLCRLIPTLIALGINLTLSLTGAYGDKSFLMLVMSSNIVAVAIDVSFVFGESRYFGRIVIRNIAVKLLTMILTFVLVRSESDVWKYELVHYGAAIAGNIVLWAGIPGLIVKVRLSDLRPMRHLPDTLRLFVPTIVMSVYTMTDKMLIGAITHSDEQNGFYEMSDTAVRTALTAVIAVNAPRAAAVEKELRNGHARQVREEILSSASFTWFAGIAAAVLLSSTACNLGASYFAAYYAEVERITAVLAFLPLIMGMSHTVGSLFLIMTGQDKKFTASVLTGACINISLNIPFIILFGAFGAAVATVIAECAVTVMQLIFVRKQLPVSRLLACGVKKIIAGVAMFAASYALSRTFPQSVLFGLLAAVIGLAAYLILLALMRDSFLLGCASRAASCFKNRRKKTSAEDPTLAAAETHGESEGAVYTEHEEVAVTEKAEYYSDDASAEHSHEYDDA